MFSESLNMLYFLATEMDVQNLRGKLWLHDSTQVTVAPPASEGPSRISSYGKYSFKFVTIDCAV